MTLGCGAKAAGDAPEFGLRLLADLPAFAWCAGQPGRLIARGGGHSALPLCHVGPGRFGQLHLGEPFLRRGRRSSALNLDIS